MDKEIIKNLENFDNLRDREELKEDTTQVEEEIMSTTSYKNLLEENEMLKETCYELEKEMYDLMMQNEEKEEAISKLTREVESQARLIDNMKSELKEYLNNQVAQRIPLSEVLQFVKEEHASVLQMREHLNEKFTLNEANINLNLKIERQEKILYRCYYHFVSSETEHFVNSLVKIVTTIHNDSLLKDQLPLKDCPSLHFNDSAESRAQALAHFSQCFQSDHKLYEVRVTEETAKYLRALVRYPVSLKNALVLDGNHSQFKIIEEVLKTILTKLKEKISVTVIELASDTIMNVTPTKSSTLKLDGITWVSSE